MLDGFVHGKTGIWRNLKITFLAADREITISAAIRHLRGIMTAVDDERLKDELYVVESLLNSKIESWIYRLQKLDENGNSSVIDALGTFKTVMEQEFTDLLSDHKFCIF